MLCKIDRFVISNFTTQQLAVQLYLYAISGLLLFRELLCSFLVIER